ncbi:MAG: integrase [Croceicoccus sp.]|nr:integrase [Croceicoccus sp.]MAL25397.1 integrase [Croceicoccus sp.]|tara:strand:- start:4731 stop:6011 length:1281 start_codon:yes stop_codon:yes gene_type:complete
MSKPSPQRERLTKRLIDAAEAGPSERFIWDNEVTGFGLRITPRGKKAFIYQYRMRGEKIARRYTIGKYGSWTAEKARERSKALAMMVDTGTHPKDADRARVDERARADIEAKVTAFDAVADRWLDGYRHTKNGKRRIAAKSRLMATRVVDRLKEKFGSEPIGTITKSDLSRFFDGIAGTASRRNVFAYSRILWNWAEDAEIISANPFDNFRAPPLPEARDRFLDDEELKLFWMATRKLSYPFGPLYRLLALTGQRESEVREMSWQELSKTDRQWTIPGSRTKNNSPHIVPLTDLMVEELNALASGKTWPKRGFVFTVNNKKAVAGLSKAKARLDGVIAEMLEDDEIEPWRNHDLRRTLATGFQRLGIRFEVTEAVLNHVSGAKGGVAGIYQRHDWKDEKRAALKAWSEHVSALVRPKVVVGEEVSA